MFREAALAASIALGIGMPEEARADLFQFNPTGGGLGAGLINGAAVLDLAPGNELGIGGGLGGAPLPAGTIIPDLYQANLSSVVGASGNVLFFNGAGGAFFTFVAGFTEQVIASSSGGGAVTNSFKILPGGFFKMCATGTAGNDLAGTGFACAGGGILSGHAIDGAATQIGFVTDLVDLDQFAGNQRGGTTTVTSVGSASLRFEVDSVLTSYFPDLVKGGHITFNMTNSTPFTAVNPSFLFSSDGIANGNLPDNIGTTNGITGPNFQVQADANFAFQRQGSVIPEPGSLALLSLGLFGLAAFARRRGNGSTPQPLP